MVQAVANGKDQFREHRRFAVLAEAGNAVAQDGLLDLARFPAGAQTKPEGYKRRLAVGGVQRVHLILQRLEGVVALFLGAGVRVAVGVRDLPLFGRFTMLVEACRHERGQHFINAVNRGAAINMAGDLSDNLRGDGSGRGD